ncbi:glycerol-3-phosphate cytidylyltransferase [Stutzerimonas kunmingensis]|uniref:glycerol-3-phosphate cytidylyltransferase n=1 Tax=Stutzerimonas kunmingensis TaxID=1211807 RepID=UPI00241F2A63|nr:glycerol-3-phosphate cytidylyltransferase [Stutzerimonas kunmingensis]
MTVVLTYGTFDILHVGHINLLRSARALGDRLVVGLSTDAFNALKRKQALQDYASRKAVLEAIRFVDEVFPEACWQQKTKDIHRYGADVFVMGGDWAGRFDYLAAYCRVIYLPRTEDISSTALKQTMGRQCAHQLV